MRDDEGGVDLPTGDPFEQRGHVAHHVRLAHTQGQPLVERGAKRNLVEHAPVDAGDGDRSSLSAGEDRLAKSGRPIRRHERGRLGLVVVVVHVRAV